MREANLGSCKFYISEEVYHENSSWQENAAWIQRTLMESLGIYGSTSETQNRFKLLHAHGAVSDDGWVFVDAGIDSPVQNWIDKMDGSAPVLMLAVCNPESFSLTSRSSFLIYPMRSFSLYEAMYGEVEIKYQKPLI